MTAVAVIGAVLPVGLAWGATDFSYGGTPRYLAGMAQTSGAAYRNYNRITGTGNDTKYVCYGPAGTTTCYAGTTVVGNSSYINIGTTRLLRLGVGRRKMRRLRDALGRLPQHSAMINPHPHLLTRRQALARVIVSVAAGSLIAVALIAHGATSSHADVQPGPSGNAAAQLGVLPDRCGRPERTVRRPIRARQRIRRSDDVHQLRRHEQRRRRRRLRGSALERRRL